MISIDEGEMPIVGPTGVLPTFDDGGACLILGLDVVLGEGDGEVNFTKWGNANQNPRE